MKANLKIFGYLSRTEAIAAFKCWFGSDDFFLEFRGMLRMCGVVCCADNSYDKVND